MLLPPGALALTSCNATIIAIVLIHVESFIVHVAAFPLASFSGLSPRFQLPGGCVHHVVASHGLCDLAHNGIHRGRTWKSVPYCSS